MLCLDIRRSQCDKGHSREFMGRKIFSCRMTLCKSHLIGGLSRLKHKRYTCLLGRKSRMRSDNPNTCCHRDGTRCQDKLFCKCRQLKHNFLGRSAHSLLLLSQACTLNYTEYTRLANYICHSFPGKRSVGRSFTQSFRSQGRISYKSLRLCTFGIP